MGHHEFGELELLGNGRVDAVASYLLRRLLQSIPLLFGISVLVFLLMQMTPGGPMSVGEGGASSATAAQLERLRGRYGLNDPIIVQYFNWLWGVVTGDWGSSYLTGRPVLEVIGERVPTTLMLTLTAFVLSLIFALLIGVRSGIRKDGWFDHVATALTYGGLAVPGFWLALMLIFIFSYSLGWLPSSGLRDLRASHNGAGAFLDLVRHLVLPVLSLVLVSIAGLARHVRSSVIEVLDKDYIRSARASGLPESVVIRKHVLKNASLPVVTIAVLMLPELFLGAVITETIFGLPGMGRLFVESADLRDYPVLLGILMIAALLVLLANLLADLVYSRLDPRISYE